MPCLYCHEYCGDQSFCGPDCYDAYEEVQAEYQAQSQSILDSECKMVKEYYYTRDQFIAWLRSAEGREKTMSDEQYLISERQKAAEKLKNLAAEVAAAFEEIAHGNKAKRREAQKFIRDHVDGYWHAVIVGNCTDVGKALADEETDL